jgi:hypothetical protein
MVASTEKFSHVSLSHLFREDLVLLRSNLVEKLSATDVLHDQVDVLLINVGLVILYDVRVV